MRVLLLSTYELGHQPLGIAGPAAALEDAGHETHCVDLAQSDWPEDAVGRADAAVLSVPMHTATRLALGVIARLRSERPGLPLACHGLYAPVLEGHALLRPSDLLVAGDPVPALLEWLPGAHGAPGSGGPPGADGAPGNGGLPGFTIELGPPSPGSAGSAATAASRPLRRELPPLADYACLLTAGESVTAASVEASRGCNHRCRHCPVAGVYKGRSRPVPVASVLADIDQVVAAGAGHISFADPDFLNRPRHALEVARALHAAHPEVSFDATVKVEHILRHESVWPELARCGLVFVVSAFESVDNRILELLDKGHNADDAPLALATVRAAGVELRPSWLPFTPWTTAESLAGLFLFSAEQDLVWSTDPIQYAIRLLLPRGSLLLADPDPVLAGALTGEVDELGSAAWVAADPALDVLQKELALVAETDSSAARPLDVTFGRLFGVARGAGVPLPPEPPAPLVRAAQPGAGRPRLSEAWFCCAEPTGAQVRAIGGIPAGGSRPPAEPASRVGLVGRRPSAPSGGRPEVHTANPVP
jgi:hypothetical protein